MFLVKVITAMRKRAPTAGDAVPARLHYPIATRVWDGLSLRLVIRFGGAGKLEEINARSFTRHAAAGTDTRPLRCSAIASDNGERTFPGLALEVVAN